MSQSQRWVAAIAEEARRAGLGVAVAESLTSGLIASRLGAGTDSATWFRGGVVAYHVEVKRAVLGVADGPVVTAECAEQMARRTAELFGADAVVAVTGVGGPDPEEGEPPGTVYVAVVLTGQLDESLEVCRLDLSGDDPERILDRTAEEALRLLGRALEATLTRRSRD